jgi:Leucine-rich repeat
VIDNVPSSLINKVQTLYLSNNHITTLDGIEQFQQLRCLSVANNLIRYVSSLRSLHQNQYLEKISLEGNVVTGMPFYRQYVIGLCPRLLILDGVNVTADERNADRSTARQLSAFYDQLRLNELQNIVLRNLFLQLNLHADFSNVVLGKFR